VNELDFQDSILVLGFSEELNKELLQLYQQHCKEIRAILSAMALELPYFHNLEWRLDVELASRSLQRQAQPTILLRLHTKQGGEQGSVVGGSTGGNALNGLSAGFSVSWREAVEVGN